MGNYELMLAWKITKLVVLISFTLFAVFGPEQWACYLVAFMGFGASALILYRLRYK